MKMISTFVFGRRKIMVMILVRKRSAVTRGLRKFLRKPGCQFDT